MAEENRSTEKTTEEDSANADDMLSRKFGKSPHEETGMERIIRTGFVSYERMPMLENVFERLNRFLSTRFRSYTNDSVDVTMKGMDSMRFGDFMDDAPSGSVFAIFKSPEWKSYGLIAIDANLTYSILNILMGGRHEGLVVHENRTITNLERDIIKGMFSTVTNELNRAFSSVDEVDFQFERIELSTNLANIVRPSNASVVTCFHVDLGKSSGSMKFVIPFSTLEPVRSKLSQQFTGDSDGGDNTWSEHMIAEIMKSDIVLRAHLPITTMPLDRIMNLKTGDVLRFPCEAKQALIFSGDQETPPPSEARDVQKIEIQIDCSGVPVASGELGRMKRNYAVEISKRLLPPEEEMTDRKLVEIVSGGLKI